MIVKYILIIAAVLAGDAGTMDPRFGLAFLGFPLHPAGRPSNERGRHLFDVVVPMLFLQGIRDALADRERITELCDRLGPRTPETLAIGRVPVRRELARSSEGSRAGTPATA